MVQALPSYDVQRDWCCFRINMVAHSEILLSKCAQFREQGEFIDVRLKIGEDEFAAHRIVLAANSDYFHGSSGPSHRNLPFVISSSAHFLSEDFL